MRTVKRQRTPARPVQEPKRNWRRMAMLGLGAVLLCGSAGYTAFRVAAAQRSDILLRQVLHDAGLSVQSITVLGRTQTEPQELLGALNVAKGDSILHVDLDAAHGRIAALPWVQEVRISRNLPNAIHVELLERQPVAIWQRNGRMVLVDDGGVEISEKDVAEYPDLPLIVGKGAPKAAAELIDVLTSEPQLHERVAAAVRVGERRWNIRFKDGIDVRLPEHDALSAWRKLARYEESNGLLGRDVEFVDLRLANRVVVRLTQDAVRRATTQPERDAYLHAPNYGWGHT